MSHKAQSIHNRAVNDIADHPEYLNLEGVVRVEVEVPVHDLHHKLLTQIDVLFQLKNGLYIPIEYKCNHSLRNENKALHQLIKAREGLDLEYHFGVDKLIYAFNPSPYNAMELIRSGMGFGWKPII